VTLISTAFAPLAQVVAEGIGHACLPIAAVAHPVGDPDEAVIRRRGEEVAAECVRLLTTPAQALARELEGKQHPLPKGLMPR
jgi:hypothetical protein